MKNTKKKLFANSKSGRGLTKLNSNAFTLIELLAIIVILAIIAVITVPIVLNIIENSRKGAATDSAYGYRDSVQQHYLSKSVANQTDPVLTTESIKTVSELEEEGLTVNGQKPSEGWVRIDRGRVVAYSLKFDDYSVTFDETMTTPISTKNGVLAVSNCPGCKFIYTIEPLAIDGSLANIDYYSSDMPTKEEGLTDDYTEMLSGQNSHSYFLGLVESETTPGKVERAFVCGVKDDIPFCLEGGINEENDTEKTIYKSNIDILNAVFSSGNVDTSNNYTYWYNSTLYAHASDDGYVDIHDSSGICAVDVDGYFSCVDELPPTMPGYNN